MVLWLFILNVISSIHNTIFKQKSNMDVMFLNQMKTGSSQTRFSFGMQLLFNKPPSIFDIIKNICWEDTVWQRLMCNFLNQS